MRRVMMGAVVACIPCLGCSFAFVSGPPANEPSDSHEPSPQCTTSVLFPVLDSVGAGVAAINVGISANASPGKVLWYGIEMESGTGVALGLTQLALFGAGAVYGFVQTSRCRSHLEQQAATPDAPAWSPATAPAGGPAPTSSIPPQAPPAQPSPAPAAAPTQTTAAPTSPPPPATSASPATSTSPPGGTAPPPASSAPSTASFPD